MARHLVLLAALALPTLCACSSAPTGPDGFPPVHAEFPVSYRASVAPLVPVSEVETIEATAPTIGDTTGCGGPVIEVECELVQLGAAEADSLFGWSPVDRLARAVDRRAVKEILDRAPASARIHTPRLSLFEDQRGTLTLASQTAYVSHFDISVASGFTVADPVVKVAADGFTVRLVPGIDLERGTIVLDLELNLDSLLDPIPVVEAHVPGSSSPVQFQQPVMCTQTLSTVARLAPSECLVLAAFDGVDSDSRLVAILNAQVVNLPDTPLVTRR